MRADPMAMSEVGDFLPVLLVSVGVAIAGVWVLRIGSRNDVNLLRFIGSALLIVGLVPAVLSAFVLVLFFLWTGGGRLL